MSRAGLKTLVGISTVYEMVEVFQDEEHCRHLMEAMVWPRGRICPRCGYRHSIAIAGRDAGKTKRPGLYQCSNGHCRYQFTVTTRTPLHSTKLPLRLWLMGMWLILQSDKGISSVRLAEALGISQQAAWRMGHALRLLMIEESSVEGVVEVDHLFIGGRARKNADRSSKSGKGPRPPGWTTKFPALAVVQRPLDTEEGTRAGSVRSGAVIDQSVDETLRVMADVERGAHVMSDAAMALRRLYGEFAVCETIDAQQYARGSIHVNSAEGFNSRVKRTIAGVFHHISRRHADLYLTEIGFRWSQRTVAGQATRRTRKGREVQRILWERVAPTVQIVTLLHRGVGRELRRTREGSIAIRSNVAAFS